MKLNITPHSPEEKLRIIRMLKKLSLFAGLHNKEFTYLCDLCNGKTYASDEYIFHEGDHSHSLFVLLSGKVQLFMESKSPLYEAHPGDFFGEIGFITQRVRAASAQAVSKCVIMEISNDDYNLLLGQQPRINAIMMQHIAENLAQHLLRTNNRLENSQNTDKSTP